MVKTDVVEAPDESWFVTAAKIDIGKSKREAATGRLLGDSRGESGAHFTRKFHRTVLFIPADDPRCCHGHRACGNTWSRSREPPAACLQTSHPHNPLPPTLHPVHDLFP